jgi:hypothetical protein
MRLTRSGILASASEIRQCAQSCCRKIEESGKAGVGEQITAEVQLFAIEGGLLKQSAIAIPDLTASACCRNSGEPWQSHVQCNGDHELAEQRRNIGNVVLLNMRQQGRQLGDSDLCGGNDQFLLRRDAGYGV